ncbi:MAG: hypothetical protein M0O93_06675 [Bacteroidales bacterium]|nr:hypothetical protein [Bacteroidales bacterium]
MRKSIIAIFWILAIILTLCSSIYQRKTGPTNPKKTTIKINDKDYKLSFPRSATATNNTITLNIPDTNVKAQLIYREYNLNKEFTKIDFNNNGQTLTVNLPIQPNAGKLEYYVSVNQEMLFESDPLILRFKGDVPSEVLIPHIIFMFVSMLFASYGLILAIANKKNVGRYVILTIITLIIGGFIFGPLVQKYAFGVYWSGFPFGYDLTDNKTLIALFALLINIIFLKKKIFRITSIIAFCVMITIFCIPHSLRGSELNHQTGIIETAR